MLRPIQRQRHNRPRQVYHHHQFKSLKALKRPVHLSHPPLGQPRTAGRVEEISPRSTGQNQPQRRRWNLCCLRLPYHREGNHEGENHRSCQMVTMLPTSANCCWRMSQVPTFARQRAALAFLNSKNSLDIQQRRAFLPRLLPTSFRLIPRCLSDPCPPSPCHRSSLTMI